MRHSAGHMLPAVPSSASHILAYVFASRYAFQAASHMPPSGIHTVATRIHPGPSSAHSPKQRRLLAVPAWHAAHALPAASPSIGGLPAGRRSSPEPSTAGPPGCCSAAFVALPLAGGHAFGPHSAAQALWYPALTEHPSFEHKRTFAVLSLLGPACPQSTVGVVAMVAAVACLAGRLGTQQPVEYARHRWQPLEEIAGQEAALIPHAM
mmetsp:Transcript_13494/g.26544  ORF Transcript_13494/g.26544 Transcript_13494/m.26544 type:complete len:208 (+) Transcript_13494:492-1115(+)